MIHMNLEVQELLDHEMITVNNEDRILAPLLILLLEFHESLVPADSDSVSFSTTYEDFVDDRTLIFTSVKINPNGELHTVVALDIPINKLLEY